MNYKKIMEDIKNAFDAYGIPCSINECWEGYQLRFNWTNGDIAIHDGTYCHEKGCVESYEFPWDDGDVSVLTPDEAIEKIKSYYWELRTIRRDLRIR